MGSKSYRGNRNIISQVTQMNYLFAKGSKDTVLSDMATSSKALFTAGEARSRYATAWRVFGEKLNVMVSSQNPDVVDKLNTLQKYLNEIADAEEQLAADERRNGDDFRDIVERYAVLFAANEYYLCAKEATIKARNDLTSINTKIETEKTKGTYSKNEAKLTATLEKCKEQHAMARNALKGSICKLIDQRSRYTSFKVRRMIQGWSRYGNALKRMCETETEIFGKIKELLGELRKEGGVSAEAVDQMEREMERRLEEAPAPSQPMQFQEEQIDVPAPYAEEAEPYQDITPYPDVYGDANDEVEATPEFDGYTNPFE